MEVEECLHSSSSMEEGTSYCYLQEGMEVEECLHSSSSLGLALGVTQEASAAAPLILLSS
jgi:hypothetical protein